MKFVVQFSVDVEAMKTGIVSQKGLFEFAIIFKMCNLNGFSFAVGSYYIDVVYKISFLVLVSLAFYVYFLYHILVNFLLR